MRSSILIAVSFSISAGEAAVPQGDAGGAPGPQREAVQREPVHRQARLRGRQRGLQRVHHQGKRVKANCLQYVWASDFLFFFCGNIFTLAQLCLNNGARDKTSTSTSVLF